MNIEEKTISFLLKEVRKKHNLTQEDVAKILNIGRTTYKSYEINQATPSIATLIKLADFYHVSLDELVGRPTSLINKMLLTDIERNIIEKVLAMDVKQQQLTEFFINTLNNNV